MVRESESETDDEADRNSDTDGSEVQETAEMENEVHNMMVETNEDNTEETVLQGSLPLDPDHDRAQPLLLEAEAVHDQEEDLLHDRDLPRVTHVSVYNQVLRRVALPGQQPVDADTLVWTSAKVIEMDKRSFRQHHTW